jgi:DeoR/GlpR family transcriptional regulator of sugar metabolism
VSATRPTGPRQPPQMRQAFLVDTARKRGVLVVSDVAAELGVSEMTIRRDLDELGRNGTLIRTHGGAMAPDGTATTPIDRDEPAFDARLRRNDEVKRRLALAAAELIGSRQTVALDVGSTTYRLAELLRERANLRFFTSSLRAASLLAIAKRDVQMPGGQVRGEEPSASGSTALEQFERFWFDVAFIGVSGMTADGLFDYSPDDSELKRLYLRRSSLKVVICDSSKFQRMSLVHVSDFSAIDTLVTDAPPPEDVAAALNAASVETRIVGPADTIGSGYEERMRYSP